MNNCCYKCQTVGITDKETLYWCIDPVCECHKDHRLMRPKGKKCDCIYCMNPSHHKEYLESVSKQEKPEWEREFEIRFGQHLELDPEYRGISDDLLGFINKVLLSEKKRWVAEVERLKIGGYHHVGGNVMVEMTEENKLGYELAKKDILDILSQELEK